MKSSQNHIVFVASTYEDLVEYRHKLDEICSDYGMHARRVEAIGAQPGSPLRVCIKQLRGSDFVIAIVAHCYGSIPAKQAGGDGRKSFTWLEIEYAKRIGKPTFCFLVDESGPWKGHVEKDPTKWRLLSEFKEHLMRDNTCARFRCLAEFETEVRRSIDSKLEELDKSTYRIDQNMIIPPWAGHALQYFLSLAINAMEFATRRLTAAPASTAQDRSDMSTRHIVKSIVSYLLRWRFYPILVLVSFLIGMHIYSDRHNSIDWRVASLMASFGLFLGYAIDSSIRIIPRGLPDTFVRSFTQCPHCAKRSPWWSKFPILNLPKLSACISCGVSTGIVRPLLEVLSAGIWAAVYLLDPTRSVGSLVVLGFFYWSMSIAIIVDFEYLIYPDSITVSWILLGPLASLAFPGIQSNSEVVGWTTILLDSGLEPSLRAFLVSALGVLGGGTVVLSIMGLLRAIFGQDLIGIGDVKFLAALGGFLGIERLSLAILLLIPVLVAYGICNIARLYGVIVTRWKRKNRPISNGVALFEAWSLGRTIPTAPSYAIVILIVLIAF